MKYYKSKRGYFYKIVGDKKIRISIQEYKSKMKGGTVESDGNLEKSDFEKRRGTSYSSNSAYHGLPSYTKITQSEITPEITPEMLDNIDLKVLRKPFYLAGEPVIFFGGVSADKFAYACHNDSFFSKKINFFELKSDIVISPISIDKISTIDLIELFYGLKNIRKKYRSFMNRLYNILESELTKISRLPDISMIRFTNKNKIKELTKFSGPKFINSNQIKQSLHTLSSLTSNPHEILAQLQKIKQEYARLLKSKGEIVAMKYQLDEFRKIIYPILLQKIKKETNRLWRSNGEVVARKYQEDEISKIIDPILLQKIKKENNRLWRSKGYVVARKYQQDEFRKIINPILQKKGLKVG